MKCVTNECYNSSMHICLAGIGSKTLLLSSQLSVSEQTYHTYASLSRDQLTNKMLVRL